MSKQININRNAQGRVVFDVISVEVSDDVFWQNNDTQPHWPVPWCSGLRMDPSKPSNVFQAYPSGSPTLPQTVVYGCAMPGHGAEQGVIYVYNDFSIASSQIAGEAGQAATVAVARGGKSPYAISATGLPNWVSLAETAPVDSSAGISATLTNPPAGDFAFTLNTTDALGKNIQQQITISIT